MVEKEAQQKDPRNNQHSKEILLHPIPSYLPLKRSLQSNWQNVYKPLYIY